MSGSFKLPKLVFRDRPTLREALWCLANGAPVKCPTCDVEGVARILYHVQGIRGGGFRTVPSAGATYPLEVYLSSQNKLLPVTSGLYKYVPSRNILEGLGRDEGFEGFIISVNSLRTTGFYGLRGYRYVRQEVGHALQNLSLSLISHGFSWETDILNLRLEDLESHVKVARVKVKLPENYCKGYLVERALSLDMAIAKRASHRDFKKEGVSEENLLNVLKWSIGEVVEGGRVYPILFGKPLIEAHVIVSHVRGLEPGIYYFNPGSSELEPLQLGDFSEPLWIFSLRQQAILKAPAIIVLSGRGIEAELESGIVGQNIYLNAVHEGMGTVAIGAFEDEKIASTIGVDDPLYLMPIGRPA